MSNILINPSLKSGGGTFPGCGKKKAAALTAPAAPAEDEVDEVDEIQMVQESDEEDQGNKGRSKRRREKQWTWKRPPLKVDAHAASSSLKASKTALAVQANEEVNIKNKIRRAEKNKVG